jgi:hypothetical protein
MGRTYPYVGPAEIAASVADGPSESPLRSPGSTTEWIKRYRHEFGRDGCVTATFVVDEDGFLRLADRHSEHVACAGGRPVLAAGEVTLRLDAGRAVAEEITNQSTGYCPDAGSWPAVADALKRAGIEGPSGYTSTFVFRRCGSCGQINIVKDQHFVCSVCRAALSAP